jgi:hypothetical protein
VHTPRDGVGITVDEDEGDREVEEKRTEVVESRTALLQIEFLPCSISTNIGFCLRVLVHRTTNNKQARLSWSLVASDTDNTRGVVQTAYEIQVTTVGSKGKPAWTSGKTSSNLQAAEVKTTLAHDTTYVWQVRSVHNLFDYTIYAHVP